jgi:hypothetical protein
MPLSISNSKPAYLFYTKVPVGICALLVVGIEIASDCLQKHHSDTFARVSRQYADAVYAPREVRRTNFPRILRVPCSLGQRGMLRV